uniref:Uncharacterized protein n=1 Tax=Solanum lycopersicum TaxID=4081 RepID=A0A3Q7J8R1_SOLLC
MEYEKIVKSPDLHNLKNSYLVNKVTLFHDHVLMKKKHLNPKKASVSGDSQGQDENDDSGPNLASKDNTDKNVKRRIRRTKQPVSSDSDCDSDLDTEDLSRDDLVKLVAEKEKLLKIKDYEFQKMKKNVVI